MSSVSGRAAGNERAIVCRAELDSHADTTALGDSCQVISKHGTVPVTGYKEKERSTGEIVTGAIAIDDARIMWTWILFLHQVLHIAGMKRHLLNPFQMREAGVTIKDTPLQHLPPAERTPTQHTLYIEGTDLHTPLTLQGTMSGFDARKPTWDEINNPEQNNCTHIHLTLPQE